MVSYEKLLKDGEKLTRCMENLLATQSDFDVQHSFYCCASPANIILSKLGKYTALQVQND